MVNYECNAACRHCLYSCSPDRRPGYVDAETADAICRLLHEGGCYSVHIGGGEPFLNFEGLLMMIRALKQAGIALEYIETNAFWAITDENKAVEYLHCLLAEGAGTLCISIDPFHAEFVPYGAPVTLANLCRKTGMDFFLWKQEYYPFLSQLDPQKTHSRSSMEKTLSGNYLPKTAQNYGIAYGGRAVNIEQEFAPRRPLESLTAGDSPCDNLLSTGHFHVDKDGYFIPPRCTGMRIPLSEAINGIPSGKYPVFETLYHGGMTALLELARQHGFIPDAAGYPSKCSLCFRIRHFLCEQHFPELDANHYEEALK